jgi:hypothetical protein
VHPEDSDGLYRAYIDATEKSNGYLTLDFAQDTNDLLRYRTNVFPEEYPTIIYVPKKYETDRIELPYPPSIRQQALNFEKQLFQTAKAIS